jgi:hypothetical protein
MLVFAELIRESFSVCQPESVDEYSNQYGNKHGMRQDSSSIYSKDNNLLP